MQLSRNKIVGIPFRRAQHIGGPITPELVVLHDTAGRLAAGNSASYLAKNQAGVSVHFIVERDGSVEQQVPTNRRANHAGRSHYHGRPGVNGFSIGVEIVNPGRMTAAGSGRSAAWFKQTYDNDAYGIVEVETPEHGAGYWMDYTADQLDAIDALLDALFGGIPSLRDVRSHWYVSPGRKVDTNPLFPLEQIRSRVLGREDPSEEAADQASLSAEADQMVQIEASEGLNMRRWPSFNPNIVAVIPDATPVPVLRRGNFEGRDWIKVAYGGREGWVMARYAAQLIYENIPHQKGNDHVQ